MLTKATITGLSSTAEYVINGTTVTGQTSYVLDFAGTNPSEAITIQVISQVDDADADLGTIQVVATAKDGNNPATTANSVGASVPVVVDAVLDRVATPDQASPASAAEQTTSQVVGLGLSLSFANTAYAAPSNQFYDGTPGDANETFAVKITVTGDAVNLQLDPLDGGPNPGVTLTEGPAGTWTLNGTTPGERRGGGRRGSGGCSGELRHCGDGLDRGGVDRHGSDGWKSTSPTTRRRSRTRGL